MYRDFFDLNEFPFELTANPRYLFLTGRQREALSILQYGLMSVKSLTLLVGDAGTGKTTLIRAALESERCRDVHCVYINNPMLSQADFVSVLAQRFHLGPEAASSKAILLERMEARLRERRDAGGTTALVVDEAQSLSIELLEELRLLANIETPTEKLLPLVLAGQPELAERLEQPALRQLKQRVALRCELLPFELGDTAAYIASRIRTAGGVPSEMFTQEAVTLVHQFARGIPRSINVICDNALIGAMALGQRRVESALVTEVCRDLHLSAPSALVAAEVGGASDRIASSAVEAAGEVVSRIEPVEAESLEPVQSVEPVETDERSSRFRFGFRWRHSASIRPSTRIVTE